MGDAMEKPEQSGSAPATGPIPHLVPVETIAAAWRVKPSIVQSWIRRGIVPAVRLGSLLLVDLDRLAVVLESRRVPPRNGAR
jgi:hypothetical protein